MGLIKDLVDLATQLDRSITDRKTRELLLPLQEKILAVQKEQLRLQQEHAEEIASLKQAHANEIAKLRKPPSEQTTNPHVVTPDQEKILGFVAARKDGAADELVAGGLKMELQVARFHLYELHDAGLLESHYCDKHLISQEGLRYLISKGLLG